MVISEAMARKFWPGQNPVGQSVIIGPGLGPAYQVGVTEIVGVVGDVRERLYFDPQPVMFQLPSQIPDADIALLNSYEAGAILVRTRPSVAPMSIGKAVQQALGLPVAKVRTMEQVGLDSTARTEFQHAFTWYICGHRASSGGGRDLRSDVLRGGASDA